MAKRKQRKPKKHHPKRLIVVLLSDTHAGHKLGLLNPETPLSDEHDEAYNPGLNTTQRYLWDLYQEHIEAVADLADGCPVMVVHNGDLTHGDAHADHLSLVTLSDQLQGGAWNLRPWYEHPRIALAHVRIMVGTASHGWEGSAEAIIGKNLATQYPGVDTRTLYHALIALTRQRGQVIDLAHHGPCPGTRKWLKGNVASYHLKSAMLTELADWKIPPILYARAHYHQYLHVGPVRIRSRGKDVESRLIITPSYSGIDDYGRRVTRSTPKLDHGLVALEFEDGLRAVHPFFSELDARTKEKLDL
jgi:hypothetical protein